ncbi:MAG: prepilin-type N-terminal cleavage/methylation domain-containing protein [Magnetococcales bacterium]|nr:prepilin-type N-terminal cleavage/methylation domain-containing protein [Magnetococcales bacterium]
MVLRPVDAGFSFIELLVTLVVIAILAALALPSYQSAVYKGNRADATTALLRIQLAEEQWRANHTTYGTLATLGMGTSSERGKYTLAVTANTATGYVATATAVAEQVNDTGCTTLTLTVSGTGESRTPAACW